MSKKDTQKVIVQPPIEVEKIKITRPSKVAAGIPAILSTAKHSLQKMGMATTMKTLFNVNQMDGFDCPGCAWPDSDDHRSGLGEYCENGAKAIAEEATKARINPDFFQKYSVSELSTYSDYWLGKQGRITQPMILREGTEHYQPISWDEAFEFIAAELNDLPSPDDAIFYTSGRTSNEAAFLYQLFVRQFGTNNLPDCSNMCHESSGVALSQTLGIGKGSVKLEDFYETDLVIIAGQNPGTNHPRMLSALRRAKKEGAKIISINPLKETGLTRFKDPQKVIDYFNGGVKLTDLYLQVKINEDVALMKAIIKILVEKEWQLPGKIFNHTFMNRHTQGYEAFIRGIDGHNLHDLVKQSGVPKAEVQQAANMVNKAERIIICWAMGLTQHKNGVANITEMVNLLLLKGSIGKKGSGTCPVRGHSNVQGDRTMGIWEKPKPAFMDKLQSTFNFEPPRHDGFNTVEAIKAMATQKGMVFFAMGGNFLSATPDTEFTAKALQNCRLTVQVSTKLNRSHLVCGKNALILPCLGRTELDEQASGQQFVSVENSMGVVHQSRGKLTPASSHLLSEPAIVCRLAMATLKGNRKGTTDWSAMAENYDLVREAIEKTIPGFENYNERVRKEGGFYLPNCAREGTFNTDSKKAKFTVNPLPKHKLQKDEYLMMTIRSHDQFNTTIYGLDDRYRGIYNGRRVVLVNPKDLEDRGLKQGDMVTLYSLYNGVERIAEAFMLVSYDIPRQCIATYFPEANVLIPVDLVADKSHTPASKSVVVKMRLVN